MNKITFVIVGLYVGVSATSLYNFNKTIQSNSEAMKKAEEREQVLIKNKEEYRRHDSLSRLMISGLIKELNYVDSLSTGDIHHSPQKDSLITVALENI